MIAAASLASAFVSMISPFPEPAPAPGNDLQYDSPDVSGEQ